jgi:hypothetical protein
VAVGAIPPLLALAYLIVFGALVGFTAYSWLLRVAPASRVGTHAYVNPRVAVALGCGMAGEPVTAGTGRGGCRHSRKRRDGAEKRSMREARSFRGLSRDAGVTIERCWTGGITSHCLIRLMLPVSAGHCWFDELAV